MANKIINNSKKNFYINCSGAGLSNVMAAIKKSLFFVGNASGPLNLSAAMDIDSFGLIANEPVSELKYSKKITITTAQPRWNPKGLLFLKISMTPN